jgi:DNA-binding response OmpR family regulator
VRYSLAPLSKAMLQSQRHETYRFFDFELDVPAYELRRGGLPVKLERQPMDLLILLVERPRIASTGADLMTIESFR